LRSSTECNKKRHPKAHKRKRSLQTIRSGSEGNCRFRIELSIGVKWPFKLNWSSKWRTGTRRLWKKVPDNQALLVGLLVDDFFRQTAAWSILLTGCSTTPFSGPLTLNHSRMLSSYWIIINMDEWQESSQFICDKRIRPSPHLGRGCRQWLLGRVLTKFAIGWSGGNPSSGPCWSGSLRTGSSSMLSSRHSIDHKKTVTFWMSQRFILWFISSPVSSISGLLIIKFVVRLRLQ